MLSVPAAAGAVRAVGQLWARSVPGQSGAESAGSLVSHGTGTSLCGAVRANRSIFYCVLSLFTNPFIFIVAVFFLVPFIVHVIRTQYHIRGISSRSHPGDWTYSSQAEPSHNSYLKLPRVTPYKHTPESSGAWPGQTCGRMPLDPVSRRPPPAGVR